MIPQTTADVRRMVDRAFAPDITLRRNGRRWTLDNPHQQPLFNQLRAEARVGKVTDQTLDAFQRAAGNLGLTVELIG